MALSESSVIPQRQSLGRKMGLCTSYVRTLRSFRVMGDSWGLEPPAQKEFLKASLVQKAVLLRPGDRARGQEEMHRGRGGDCRVEGRR